MIRLVLPALKQKALNEYRLYLLARAGVQYAGRAGFSCSSSSKADTVVLVESPSKAKKIQTFLGPSYQVDSVLISNPILS